MKRADFLVIGGGVIGIAVSHELKRRYKSASVTVIEKEAECGLHASGRNSGVLHAGFYYTADSLKAKFTQTGNRLLTRYCEEKKLSILKCGKLVVAKDETQLPYLDELLIRGKRNGVPLQMMSDTEARKIEPRVRTFEKALFSPTTSTIEPTQVVQSLKRDAREAGVEFHQAVIFQKRIPGGIRTNQGDYSSGYIVNCAGLYADKIALQFGFSQDYRILPFKGLYLYLDEPAHSFKTHIYPVPDLRNPFLGVHFTLTVDHHVKIGPTAIPALWREQYAHWDNFRWGECVDILMREAGLLFASDFDFMKLALEEKKKSSKKYLVKLASSLAADVEAKGNLQWGKPGIRAQLMHIKERKLVMDFVLEGDERSLHILNAVSPGFTCAIPFSHHVCDKITSLIRRLSKGI